MRETLRWLAIMLGACGAIPTLAADAPGQRYYLGVGVEGYLHEKLRQPPLKFSVEDVTQAAELLGEQGYQTVLLTDDTGAKQARLAPTRENILREIGDLLRKTKPSDTVILALAGHGLQFARQPDAYYCPIDARPFPDETKTLVSISEIYQQFEKSFAGVKVILVDACRNDPDPTRGRGLDADSAPPPPKGVAALFSCSAGQKAFENDDLRHGVFFHYVLEGLRGEAKNAKQQVTFYSLTEYVAGQVPGRVEQIAPGRAQEPNMRGDLKGTPPVLVALRPSMPGNLSDVGTKAGEIRTFNDELGLRMVWCPPGEFEMGSPLDEIGRGDDDMDQHRESIRHGFWIGRTEVTRKQWKDLMGSAPWSAQKDVPDGDDLPATHVSYRQVEDFCQRATEKSREAGIFADEIAIVLPSEAQWEYACRSGTTGRFPCNEDKLLDHAWIRKNTLTFGQSSAREVSTRTPNAWGIYDMLGNVAEWCRGKDPDKPQRGGSYLYNEKFCRVAARSHQRPEEIQPDLGFRIVVERRTR